MSYNERMKHPRTAQLSRWRLATWLVALVTLFLAFFELFQVFVALQAGIAGLSLALFTPLLLLAGFLAYAAWRQKLHRTTLLALLTALVALLAMAGPQTAYLSTARKAGVELSFDPLRYITFTGDSIPPTQTPVYKTVDGQKLRLAFYESKAGGNRPAVFLLHGGGWQYGDYRRTNNWPRLLTRAGYHVFSVEYRLASADHPTWDKAPRDVSDAIIYVKKHAQTFGVHPDQLALLGQSAGGHLALLEANTSGVIKAVIGLYSPTDLTADYERSIDKDAELAFLGGAPTDQVERYRAVSVPLAVTNRAPATLLIQGTSDDLVHFTSSTNLDRQLSNSSAEHHLILIPYTGHSFDNQVGGFATQIAEQAVLDFLAATLR